jgi:selenide,water dikinase
MTDVTGFGLAGHLMNMMRASGTGARLDLAAVPVFDGAEALATAGVRSTLYPENRAALADAVLPETPRAALLCDPQTGGGLLAAVPEAEAHALVGRLADAGYRAARIGTVIAEPNALHVV